MKLMSKLTRTTSPCCLQPALTTSAKDPAPEEEEAEDEEEEDHEGLNLHDHHDPHDPSNPPHDPPNPPSATNLSTDQPANTPTNTNPNDSNTDQTDTNLTNPQVQGGDEPAWTQEQQRTIMLMVEAGYTQEEATAAIRASLPLQVQEGQHEANPLQEDPGQPNPTEEGVASTYEELRHRVQRAGEIDSIFRAMLPHTPLPFMQVQEAIQQEALKPNCPEKELGGFRALKAEDFTNPGAMKNQPRWRLRFFPANAQALITYHHALLRRRIDPTYCPIPRRRTWARFFDVRQIHEQKQWLNYPAMPPPSTMPFESSVRMSRT